MCACVVSIVSYDDKDLKIMSCCWEINLGGYTIDKIILNYIKEKIFKDKKISILNNKKKATHGGVSI